MFKTYQHKETGAPIRAVQFIAFNHEDIEKSTGDPDIFKKHPDITQGCFVVEVTRDGKREFDVRTEINFLTCYEAMDPVKAANTKYFFGAMENGDIRVIEGDYKLIRPAARDYGNKYNKKFLVTQTETGAIVERFK